MASALPWFRAKAAPVVFVVGPEQVLADRAVSEIYAQVKKREPGTERTIIEASTYSKGALRMAASPSLFGEPSFIIATGAESMSDDFLNDALEYVQAPESDVVFVIRHSGAVRGKKLLETARKLDIPEISCPAIKKEGELIDFAQGEFERAGSKTTSATVRALVSAIGADLSELAAACQQLIADVTGSITPEVVARYYGQRVNATSFEVADAVVAGASAKAVALVRHALHTGSDPVPLVAALAMKLRALAKVAAARGGKVEGMAPWQADKARKELSRWTPQTLAEAIELVAQADADVKGAARAPAFTIERTVLKIAGLARS